jgi:hypothetical protein
MGNSEDHCKFIGFFVLVIVIITLFSSPSLLLSKTITVIGTELSYSTSNEKQIRTRIDLGHKNCFRSFPKNISGWESMEYDTTVLGRQLDADVLLMRRYKDPINSQPVFFLITHSDNHSSFHPPIICYPSLGYTIIEETLENIFVKNVSWAEKPFYSTFENKSGLYFNADTPISVKKLTVIKERGGTIVEKRVVLYFYVKNAALSSNEVTMVSVSSVVPSEERYEETLTLCKTFAGLAFSYLFEMQPEDESIVMSLIKSGIGGISVVIGLIAMPFSIILYPWMKRKRG